MPLHLLAPCPFCETIPTRIFRRSTGFHVYCPSCKARGPIKQEESEAMDSWSRTRGVLRSIQNYTNDLPLYRDDTYSARVFRYPPEEENLDEDM